MVRTIHIDTGDGTRRALIHSVGHACDRVNGYRPRGESGLGVHHVGEVSAKSMKNGLGPSTISDEVDFELYSRG